MYSWITLILTSVRLELPQTGCNFYNWSRSLEPLESFWEADSRLGSRGISRRLWRTHRILSIAPPGPVMSQMNLVNVLISVLLPSSFVTEFLCAFVIPHVYCMTRPSRSPPFGHSNNAWKRVQVFLGCAYGVVSRVV